MGTCGAVVGTDNHFLVHQHPGVQRYGCAFGCMTNENSDATSAGALDSLKERLARDSNRFKSIVDTGTAAEFLNPSDSVLLRGVDRVGRAKRFAISNLLSRTSTAMIGSAPAIAAP